MSTQIGIGGANIYTADGSLTAARTLTLATFPLTILGNTSSRFFANGNIGIGTISDSGFKLDVNGTARIQGRQSITSDTSVTTQTSSVIQATTTNASLVLTPNGTGAILASIPDGTATGGNARASYALDLQTIRLAADQIARGAYSAILGGYSNTASGIYSVTGGRNNFVSGNSASAFGYENSVTNSGSSAMGWQNNVTGGYASALGYQNSVGGSGAFAAGQSNSVSGAQAAAVGSSNTVTGNNSTIAGGQNNRIIIRDSFIGGGNTNNINSSNTPGMVIVGGNNNTIAQNDQGVSPNFIGGGANNTAQGGYSLIVGGKSNNAGGYNIDNAVIGGGQSNVASQENSVIPGGISNTASGANSVVIGGQRNISSGAYSLSSGVYSRAFGDYSVGLGYGGTASFPGQLAVSSYSSYFGLLGDNGSSFQFSDLLCYNLINNLTTGQTLVLYPGNSSSNLLIPAIIAKVWHVTAKYTMYVATKIGTVDLINDGDTLFGTASFGYRSGAGAFVTSTFAENKVSNNVNINTALFTFSVGASNELKVTLTAPTFTGGGQLRLRCNVKLELVETIQGIGGF